MGASIMMYILPMMLGQTYDMEKYSPGVQIFPDSAVNNSVRIEQFFTDSQYRMVDNSNDIKNFLNVEGKLSLKIKGGMVDVSGEGSYLRDSSSRSNTVEILVKVHFETVTFTIPSSAKPNSLEAGKFLGTHFCRSITYGGELIASVRFVASGSTDKEKIKGAIQGGLNAKGIDANIKGQLEMLKDVMEDSSSMEINYYASVPIPGVSHTIEGLMNLVSKFPDHVRKVNNGLGSPLRMELYPLEALSTNFPTYLENRALNDQLDDLEDQFDDLRATKREAGIWLSDLPPIVPEPIQVKIEKFIEKLEDIYAIFYQTISDLDLAVGTSKKPFDDAFAAYKDGENSLPHKYMRKFRKLKKEIDKEAPELTPEIGGASFIRWGKDTCGNSSDIETASSGVIIASDISQDGGSSDYACSPAKTSFDRGYYFFQNNRAKDTIAPTNLFISPILYKGQLAKYEDMYDKTISCSVCRVKRRTTTLVLQTATLCPASWSKEYDGLLMAPGLYATKGQYICIDSKMETAEATNFGTVDKEKLPNIKEVTMKCGSLPCKTYKPGYPLPCVVCTR